MLLKLLLDDLQQLARAGDAGPENPSKSSVPLPAVSRRILPHLRLYSAWFLSNVHLLLLGATDSLSIQVQELWQVYAEALSLLVATFPVLKLPELSYLLEEDQDTLSFTPFSDLVREQRYKNADGTIKSVASDKRDPELEMLHRIRDLVKDGAYLCRHRVHLSLQTRIQANRCRMSLGPSGFRWFLAKRDLSFRRRFVCGRQAPPGSNLLMTNQLMGSPFTPNQFIPTRALPTASAGKISRMPDDSLIRARPIRRTLPMPVYPAP